MGDTFTWKYYNWKKILEQFFTSLPGISRYHSFQLCADHAGFVFVQENSDAMVKKIKIIKPPGLQQVPGNFSTELTPLGYPGKELSISSKCQTV